MITYLILAIIAVPVCILGIRGLHIVKEVSHLSFWCILILTGISLYSTLFVYFEYSGDTTVRKLEYLSKIDLPPPYANPVNPFSHNMTAQMLGYVDGINDGIEAYVMYIYQTEMTFTFNREYARTNWKPMTYFIRANSYKYLKDKYIFNPQTSNYMEHCIDHFLVKGGLHDKILQKFKH